jgi:hypothetical protein
MDTSEFGEGQYLNPEMVEQSPTKKIGIQNEGTREINKFGNPSFSMTVMLDGKPKTWTLRQDHVKSFQSAFGKDSKLWIGQSATLRVVNIGGKKQIVVIPDVVKVETVQ